VLGIRVWAMLLGVVTAVVEGVELDDEGSIVVAARPRRRERNRCGVCRRRSPGYDQGEGRRRWRALDVGLATAYVEAEAPRVTCRDHGVVVAAVPWARHDARFTTSFEDQIAWLAVNTSKTAVALLMRVTWRTVGGIITRVVTEARGRVDPFAQLTRIGIDEVSYRRGQRYLTVVLDHDSGRLIWAAPGRDEKTLQAFFDLLGDERCARILTVSADGASWIAKVVTKRCPQAVLCTDPFHVVQWATDALDEVRREVWNLARHGRQPARARELKNARWVLWRNQEDLTERQEAKLAIIARTNKPLYRGYLLKEQLRLIFQIPDVDEARAVLDGWIAWARRSRLPAFVKLAKTIITYRPSIEATLVHGLSNARVEAANTKIRLIIRRGFGFHSPEAVIALAMLTLGGLCPPLPGRA
jgi:transposase